jgi:beta-lactamase class A
VKNSPLLLYIATSVIVGFIAGWVVFGGGADRNIWLADSAQQIRSGEGRYTNPLLECDVAQGAINATKINFHGELAKFVGGINGSIGVSDVAVYFRDLNNGPAFGVKQDDLFIPASLLKVPVMMAYFKAAEKTPEILSTNVSVPTDILSVDIPQLEPPEKRIEVGKQYSVEELITRMIVYSDNQSLISLFEKMPGEELMNLYKLLGVDSTVISDPTPFYLGTSQ